MHRSFTISSLRFLSMAMAAFAFIGSSTVSFKAIRADGEPTTAAYGAVVVADAHPYRHCHNLPKRTYCHKANRLPPELASEH